MKLSIFILFVVATFSIAAQTTTPATTGMVAPTASGAGAPATYLTCNSAANNLEFINTSTQQKFYCNGSTWIPVVAIVSSTPTTSAPPIIATANNYVGNTSAITNQTECSTSTCGAGEYLLCVSLSPTSTATLGTISLNLSFTDTAGAQTPTAINALALTTKTSAGTCYPLWSTGSAAIVWSTTVAGISGAYAYDVRMRILKLS